MLCFVAYYSTVGRFYRGWSLLRAQLDVDTDMDMDMGGDMESDMDLKVDSGADLRSRPCPLNTKILLFC